MAASSKIIGGFLLLVAIAAAYSFWDIFLSNLSPGSGPIKLSLGPEGQLLFAGLVLVAIIGGCAGVYLFLVSD
jgi:hypothetical protein